MCVCVCVPLVLNITVLTNPQSCLLSLLRGLGVVNYGLVWGVGVVGGVLSGCITQTHGNVFLTQNTLSEVDYNTRFRLNKAETEITGKGGGGVEDNMHLLGITMVHFTFPKDYSCID